MTRIDLRHVLVLGLLTALGPFGIDMYLPALPGIASAFHAEPRQAQASLTAYFAALGAGQLLVGPLSDAWGRKRPVLGGLALFVFASLGCLRAGDITTFTLLRFVQGLGACAAMVTPRAVVRDLHTGPRATRMMALLLNVYSVSPILAPAIGSAVAAAWSWQGIFFGLAAAASVGIAAVAVGLPESRPAHAHLPGGLRAAFAGYGQLLRDRRFIGSALTASFAVGTFFVYVAHSSFVLTSHFGLSPAAYAALFALNAVAVVLVSQANGTLVRRFGASATVRSALCVQATAALLLLALTVAGVDSLLLLVVLLAVAFGCNGVTVPNLFMLAMQEHPQLAGSASALIGTLNFAGGALLIYATSLLGDVTPLTLVAGVAASAGLALIVGSATLRKRAPVGPASP